MTEQRPISYKSLGFTLGLGGIGGGVGASGTAASSFLDTLLASVPSAKALLPTFAPQLSKAKTAVELGHGGQRNEGLASAVALQPAVAATQAAQANSALTLKQQPEELELQEQPGRLEPKQEPTPAVPAAEVIDLLSDSDGELEAAVAVDLSKLTATPMKTSGVAGDVKPVLAEFIPLPKTAPGKSAAAAGGIKAAAPGSADALAEEEDIRKLGQRPYWMSYVSSIDSPLLRLHQELVELCELVQPTPEEAAARRDAVAAVTDVVQSIWPNAKCEIFGSYATGLYVPTSDIDLVILDSGCTNIQSGLKALASSLAKRQVGQSLQVIGKARVPIVKFDTVNFGNLAFDVSFDVANGPQAAVLVTEMTAAWPMMRPLILCLKLFLQQRELNEVYTGGIGSYALITLVAAFLQLHASRRPKGPAAGGESVGGKRGRDGGGRQQPQPAQPLYGTIGDAAKGSLGGGVEPGLGTLLVDFFRFYGRVVNMPEVGISCAGGGQFFRKMDKDATTVPYGFSGWLNKERNYLLSVEDPKDPDNDVCRNSFNIMRVKTAFEYAYQMLTAPSRRDESLLTRILRLGPILASRPRPRVQHLRQLGYYATPPERDELRRDRRQRLEEMQQQRGQDEQLGDGDREKPASHDAPSQQAEARAATSPGAKAGGAGATPGRSAGKKRGREGAQGGDGGEEGRKRGEASGKKARPEAARHRRGGKNKQREDAAAKSGGAGPPSGNGRAKKRGREETSPAAATAAAGDATPSRSGKRARVDGGRQQQNRGGGQAHGGGRARDAGGHGGGRQQERQAQPPQRRPALMQVAAVPAAQPPPQQQAPAPIFHPGYAPPPSHQHHRQHHSHHRELHRGSGASARSQHHQHSQHHSHGQQHQHHQHHPHDGHGDGYSRGQGWQRAPTMLPQQREQPRSHHHHHQSQRTHVFFD